MLCTVYYHLGDSWKWVREAIDFAASLFYDSISGVSKWFFLQVPSETPTLPPTPVHSLGTNMGLSGASRPRLASGLFHLSL